MGQVQRQSILVRAGGHERTLPRSVLYPVEPAASLDSPAARRPHIRALFNVRTADQPQSLRANVMRAALTLVGVLMMLMAAPQGTASAADPGDTWTPVAPMQFARFQPAAVAGPDGRIYAIGGNNGGVLAS